MQAARCNSNLLLTLQDNQDFFSEMNAEKGPNSWGKGDACENLAFFVAHALQSVCVCVMSQSLRAALCQPLTVPMTAAPDSL